MRYLPADKAETLEVVGVLEQRGFVEITDGRLNASERGAVAFFLGVARDPLVREYARLELAQGQSVENGLVLASLLAFQAESGLDHLPDPLSSPPITDDEQELIAEMFGRPLLDAVPAAAMPPPDLYRFT